MNASYQWLRDFVDTDLAPGAIAELLTGRCATVEGIEYVRADLGDVVIGKVVDAARHPDSDHLWVTRVDWGAGATPSHVVCGAPNVTVGMRYPFAPVGATLPGGLRIEKRKIRGELSEGMLCSARELQLGSDHEGILALDTNAEPGTPFLDVMPGADTRLTIDVLPNRPDLLSHEGLAREIAAATGKPLRRPTHPPAAIIRRVDSSGGRGVEVTIDDPDGTPRYMTATIRGVTVGDSPDWLKQRIESTGSRSINNVVDVTNYMLHGFGQPMHAFDLARIEDHRIIVRRAREGERLVTLDGVDRALDEAMTVIASSGRAQAIGGVIGGKGSEVTGATTDILLEAAAFDSKRIRATRRKLGVSTDASYRFERGVDMTVLPDLLAYAAELVVRVAGGSVDDPFTDATQGAKTRSPVRVRLSRVRQILGVEIEVAEIERNLSSVGFRVEKSRDELIVEAPAFRGDVEGEIEVIEEIARLHGYDAFPSEIAPVRPGSVPDARLHVVTRRVRDDCIANGLLEARPMPFVRQGYPSHRVLNPLAEDEAYLRTSVLESLARRVEYNFAHMRKTVRLFEIGTVFTAELDGGSGAPRERIRAGAVIAGARRPAHFTEAHPPHYDMWDAKALGESIARAAYPAATIRSNPSTAKTLWTLSADDGDIGTVAEVDVDAPVWAAVVFGVEIDLGEVERTPRHVDRDTIDTARVGAFHPIPSMPAIEVDLALIVPDSVSAQRVMEAIRESAGELLETLEIFDEFRGEGVAAGTRSLGWRLTFRHPERTLRDREIQGRTARILGTLEAALGIRQRTS